MLAIRSKLILTNDAAGVTALMAALFQDTTANALATTLCVLKPEEGLKLVEGVEGAACLIIDASGRPHRSAGFKLFEVAPARALAQDKKDAPTGAAWRTA